MARDEEFHELATRLPEAVLALLRRQPRGAYRATSVELKRVARRIDVLLEPERPDDPLLVVEMQRRADPAAEQQLLRKVVELADRRGERHRIEAAIIYSGPEQAERALPAAIGPRGMVVPFAPQRLVLSEASPAPLLRRGGTALAALPLAGPRDAVASQAPAWAERIRREPGLDAARRRETLEVFAILLADRLDIMDVSQLLGVDEMLERTATGKALMRKATRKATHKARLELVQALLEERLGPLDEALLARVADCDAATLKRLGLIVARCRTKTALRRELEAELMRRRR